ncbi:MAG: hypothetical protein KDA57_00040 [Planctomycetales bacterium]|nr:hypothetical protein [Planctomycetales bacterium]
MTNQILRSLAAFIALTTTFASGYSAHAHFLWLKTARSETETRAVLSFGESAEEENYKLPEAVESAELWWRGSGDKTHELFAERVETDDRVVLEAPLPSGDPRVVEAACTYGIYHTTLLRYYVKHIDCPTLQQLGRFGPSKELKLDLVPQATDEGLQILVFWNGKPLPKVSLKLNDSANHEQTGTSDEQGHVAFDFPAKGLIHVLGSFVEEDAAGEHEGGKYKNISNYATLTFKSPTNPSTSSSITIPATQELAAGQLPRLPEPVASFGAAVLDGWLYVYGGHTGGAHEHSRKNLSNHFRRLHLAGGQPWEELPMETPLQGFPLVAHGKALYRVGGMNARNKPDEDDDLFSVAEFARFDPATGQWTALPSLPAPSSSHDAVVIGDRLYVAGGWMLEGGSVGTWHDRSLVFDLGNPQAAWQELPSQPFQRRALAVSHWQGKLAVLGGIDADGEVSRRLDYYDPASGQWSRGPDLPGEGTSGFGVSAWNLDGHLYQSGLDGIVYRLASDGTAWQPAGSLQAARFFHRLLPGASEGLLAVAGASFQTGHLADIETIKLPIPDPN